ncbi:esterase family protein [Qipengyuania xiapuensis]|uniref:Esterase family protein n=1 Tax=Qipengyuania xiapuensis TaxID=2867236 RepID=A0ABX8ZT53_9SPHN|nr:alpha/beta hydrolase-fold protein [Qipengyuania xiapuensis]QZD92198.1 esterase family protein [Qipengyuania xiapuensis]
MIRAFAIVLMGVGLASCDVELLPTPAGHSQTIELEEIAAEGLPDQRVTVWLPPEYEEDAERRFPVLYMWDGQNLLDPAQTHYGKAWMIQDVMKGLVAAGEAEPHIVVGIWSPDGMDRYRVYVPQFVEDADGAIADNVAEMAGGPIASQRQLDWVADDLTARIDSQYRTIADPEARTIAGASMGGVMSCFAIIERPDVFDRAGCISAHFALVAPEIADGDAAQVERLWDEYLTAKLGAPDGRRVWMDHGTVGLDGYYAPWQEAVAADFRRLGWQEGEDFTARVYEGAEHDEIAWNRRMPAVLRWLWRDE